MNDDPNVLEYVVIFERTPRNWSAYVPDLPGCIATGKTRDEVRRLIREGIGYYLEAMAEDGQPAPEQGSWAEVVSVPRPTPV
jgi:predicted RNase H-like HicB family nuclease